MEEQRPPDLLSVAYRAALASVADVLAQGSAPPKTAETTRNVARLLDGMLRPLDVAHPPACRAGCSWCCHVRVACTPAEAISVAAYVHSEIEKRARRELIARLEVVCVETRSLDSKAWARRRFPCPFLGDGLCTVHPARPLACRGWHSFDVRQCRRHYESPASTIQASGERLSLRGAVSNGLRDGLRRAGLNGESVDLGSAVQLTLSSPEAVERWLRGEDAFSAAKWPG